MNRFAVQFIKWDVINAVPYETPKQSVGDTAIAIRQSPARRANIECDLSHTRGPGAQPLVSVIKLRDQFGHFASFVQA